MEANGGTIDSGEEAIGVIFRSIARVLHFFVKIGLFSQRSLS